MTKITIFGKTAKEPEPELRLKLIKDGTTVVVIAVGENGESLVSGRLLKFTADGKVRLEAGVHPDIPVSTDGNGRILVT